MESCWVCKSTFTNRKQLKQHVGKEHAILSVVCPLCIKKEVQFKRVSDLKVHCAKAHPIEFKELDDDTFNESNGFYLSVFPNDYSKIITKSDRLSPNVVKIRTLMLMWAKKMEGKCSKTRQQLLDGWDIDEEIYSMPKELTMPIVHNTDIVIKQISLNTSCPHVDFEQGYHKIRATLTSDFFDDKFAMRAVARRLATLKNPSGHKEFDINIAKNKPELKSSVATVLGIHRSLVENVKIIEIEMGTKKLKLASDAPSSPELPEESSTKLQPVPNSSTSVCEQLSSPPVISTVNIKPANSTSVTASKQKMSIISTMNSDMLAQQPPRATVNNKNLPYRAMKLLRMGAMPLFPPARREWTTSEAVTLTEGSLSIKWPPKNWVALSPDQKLLQLEFLSFQILQERGINTSNLDRSDILDEFNFLALPGTKAYTLPDKVKHPASHSRFDMYTTLRFIANGKGMKDEKWLSMVECGCMLRETKNDKLLRQCQNVPLRI